MCIFYISIYTVKISHGPRAQTNLGVSASPVYHKSMGKSKTHISKCSLVLHQKPLVIMDSYFKMFTCPASKTTCHNDRTSEFVVLCGRVLHMCVIWNQPVYVSSMMSFQRNTKLACPPIDLGTVLLNHLHKNFN